MPKLGLVDVDEETRDAIADALEGVASVYPTKVVNGMGGAVVDVLALDALLLPMSAVVKNGVGLVARCMAAKRGMPVLILARSLSGGLVDQLMTFGVANFLGLPIEPSIFRRKVERALDDRAATAARNLRKCYRATVPTGHVIEVRLLAGEQSVQSLMVDMSIATEGQPGGMLLRCNADDAANFPVADWKNGEPIDIVIDMGPSEHNIRGLAKMVGDIRPSNNNTARLAVQYEPNDPRENSRLRDLWIDMQRRLIA